MRTVIYLVEDKGCAQYRYRVENLRQVLSSGAKWRIVVVMKDEIEKAYAELDTAELVVVLRQSAKDNAVINLMKAAKRRGVKVLFDLDDLVFDFGDLPLLLRTTNSKNVFYWVGYFWGVRRIAKRADGFITTNDFLGRRLKRAFGVPYRVIYNSLNKRQVEISERYRGKKKPGFVVGYFSGSPTHARDFGMVEEEVLGFLDRHEDAKMLVVGYMEFSGRIKRAIEDGKVEVKKLVSYEKLQELVAGVSVNIAPLIINDFTNSKSELKYFEAAAVETTTIASPSYTFARAIKDGKNGFLVRPGEWGKKLEFLHENAAANRKIAKEARESALKKYYGEEIRRQTEEAYDYFAD